MRRLIALSALLIAGTALAATFPDTANHPHEEEIDFLARNGVVEGYPGGYFGPDLPINRAEFLKILLLSAYGETALQRTNLNCFTDFRGQTEWYWTYACTAKTLGLVEGHPDGTFRGETQINLAEALKMIMAAWPTDLLPRLPGEPWYAPYMVAAERRGLFDNFLRDPAYRLTRSDMAYLIVHVGGPIVGIESDGGVIPGPAVCGNGQLERGEQCDDGNLQNGDGCSSICVIVSQPIRHGALRINQKASGAGTIAAGTRNAILMAFEGLAGRQDLRFNGVTFAFAQGDAQNFTQFRLFAGPASGPLQPIKTGIARGSKVDFGVLDFYMQEGVPYRFEVRGDLQSNAPTSSYLLTFDTSNPAFVQAVGMIDGRDLAGITVNGNECQVSICWIDVRTISIPPVTSAASGNLYIERALPALHYQLLAGQETPDLLRLTLEAKSEMIEVTMIRIAGFPQSAHELRLYVDGSSTAVASATPSRCTPAVDGSACAILSLSLTPQQVKTIGVRALLKSDAEGADSGEVMALSLPITGEPAVEAVGLGSQSDLTLSDSDAFAEGEIFIGRGTPGGNIAINGSTSDVVLAKINAIENSNPDASGSPIFLGVQRLARFRFTVAANENTAGGRNEVRLERIRFTVTASNVVIDPTSYTLIDSTNPALSASCSAAEDTGTITVTCDNLQSSTINAAIHSGQARDFELRGNITSMPQSAGNALLLVSLNQLSDRSTPGTIRWNDEVTPFEWVELPVTEVGSTDYER